MKPYNKSNIPLAKKLRKEMTPWERKLWYDFLRDYPIRFQRQKAIGDYIADFYCAKARLVIELDGGGHYEEKQMQADMLRTRALQSMKLKVVRICNLDVDKNFSGVCEHIHRVVQNSLPQSPAATAPSSEGAGTVLALGFFDGVHLGHQALLKACRELADSLGAAAAVLTFDRHPGALVSGEAPALINTAYDRELLLRRYGVDRVILLPFDEQMMQTPWRVFFHRLVEEFGAAGLVCGDDFRFGCRGEGNARLLKTACEELGIPCTVVPEQTVDGVRVSSTHIRGLIEEGRMEEAVRFLGHPHVLSGQVVTGRRLGRTMGIPTANLALQPGIVVPRSGVYACKIGEHLAVTNVGTRPTVGGSGITVEPWILDFEGDLYGKNLTLEFHAFLRPEQKFDSLEKLQEEIRKNAAQTREFFGKK